MKNLFIDTNIWLSLYHFTKDDLYQFEKLKNCIGKSINLIITKQVHDEIIRNRENKIMSAIKEFEVKAPVYPAFTKGYEEFNTFNKEMENIKKSHKKWKEKIENDIANNNLPADKTISEFFNDYDLIPCDDVVDLAYNRYRIGNPPGKDNKYGDAINWEALLKNTPDYEDIVIISADKDYSSIIDSNRINPFLENEWKRKKNGNIKLYTHLVDFLSEHDIVLETEKEKGKLINKLKESPNFISTHGTIAMLKEYSGWTEAQIEELCKCVCENSQVGWILEDYDVSQFYFDLLDDSNIDLNKFDCARKVSNKLGIVQGEVKTILEDEEFGI